jgi:prepilin-type N-terminal cleavage/methylation domain-containing protein
MQTAISEKRGSQAGLTLIEVLVSLIIMSVISTMLVGAWISLQRSYIFTSLTNSARATARDALDRMSSDLRASQPPTAVVTTQFYLPATPTYPYMCGPTSCVFYSAYNNFADQYGDGLAQTGTTPPAASAIRLTAIWLDASTSTLYWQRDTDNNGLTASDRKIVLARKCVKNAAVTPSKPIFTYYFRDPTTGVFSHASTLASSGANNVANLRSVRMELVIDINLAHTPTYVDLATTVRPRNAAALN